MTFFFYFFFNQLPPLLSLAPFVGCIELGSLNNDVISLYNFKETHKMNVVTSTPCLRYATYNYSPGVKVCCHFVSHPCHLQIPSTLHTAGYRVIGSLLELYSFRYYLSQ